MQSTIRQATGRFLGACAIVAAIAACDASVASLEPTPSPTMQPAATAQPTATPTARAVITATPTPRPAVKAATGSKAEQAYRLAFEAIGDSAGDFDDCEDEPDDCSGYLEFVAGMIDPTPVYRPGVFIGLQWRCGDEQCYAGRIWQAGKPRLETGP